MQKEQKQLMGKMLGEFYKLQHGRGLHCPVSKASIYGLLNGMETVIDAELERIGWSSGDGAQITRAIFGEINDYPQSSAEFKGYTGLSDKV